MINIFTHWFYFPTYGLSSRKVLQRNALLFARYPWSTLLLLFFEPLIYFLAIGFGLGSFIHIKGYASYVYYFAPSLIIIASMFSAFYLTTYFLFDRLHSSKSYQLMKLTGISNDEISLGELIWATGGGTLSGLFIYTISVALNIFEINQWSFALIPVIVLNSWLFASLGLLISTKTKTGRMFTAIQALFILPTSLMCGTYFPLSALPELLQWLSYALPLTHSVELSHMFLTEKINSNVFLHILYLIVWSFILTNWSSYLLHRRLQEES